MLTVQEPLPAPPPEPEIMQTLKKVCKLPIRKQRQITDFIEMIMAKKASVGKWS
ncbi:hypothetical protein LVQ78_23820 [Buttiauxella sp. A2-C2_NF]|uniref:hypothetical protein n=1 Tax=Buttiauxella ferragutiae TaxID=82989 RepID=UPI001E50DF25|nr:hypothetical protein [Buttiauxella ferragutiae]MCE0829015.1 hypothetical protein [Buttiauxella ferragutiae]UNK63051.1 hypothetical protein MNO13_09090 [Buttiauxella ferragutiae]